MEKSLSFVGRIEQDSVKMRGESLPFDVNGFVEVRHSGSANVFNSWSVAVHLLPFNLRGDMVSQLLFGLSRGSSIRAVYERRGLPPDPSEEVMRWFQENERFVKTHGDGDFDHTFATWREIEMIELEGHGLDTSPWKSVFQIIRAMSSSGKDGGVFMPENIRIVVAANW